MQLNVSTYLIQDSLYTSIHRSNNAIYTEAITRNYFLCLNPKNSVPILEDDGNPDFKPQTESADELLSIWRKGQIHLNEFLKHWYNHYLFSFRERYQTRLQQPRIKSRMSPVVAHTVHTKEWERLYN